MVDVPETFDIDTSVRDDVGTIRVAGDLDVVSAPRLIRVIRDLVRAMVRRIDVDCRRVDFVDSAGIRALIVGRNEARGMGAEMRLISASASMQRVLDITGLTPVLAFY